MKKLLPLLLLMGILVMGVVSATGYLYDLSNTWTDYNFITGGSSGGVLGNTVSIGHVTNIGNIVYTTNTFSIGAYNISTNRWYKYYTCSGSTGGGALASVNDLLFTGSCATTGFGVINTTTSVLTNLSTTDPGDWVGGSSINDIAIKDNLVFTGLLLGKFGAYNISDGVWYNLSGTDPLNWVGTTAINSLAIYNNLVYTGLANGKFGVYNISDGVWYDLSSTDPLNWVGASITISIGIDSSGKVYTSGTSSSIGIYDPATNIWAQKNMSSPSPMVGTVVQFTYNDNKMYMTGLGSSGGNNLPLVYYDILNDSFNLVNDVGLWSLAQTGTTNGVVINNNIYFGLTFSGLGVYKSNATEAWQQSPYNCIGGTRTIEYTDLNNVGTTFDLPVDNGTVVSCSNVLNTYGCALFRQSYTNTIFNLSIPVPGTLSISSCFQPLNQLAQTTTSANQIFKNVLFTCEGRTLTASTSGSVSRNGFDWAGSTYTNVDNITISNCTFNNWLYAIRMSRMNITNGVTFNNLSFTRSLTASISRDILVTTTVGSGTLSITNIYHKVNVTDTSAAYITIIGTGGGISDDSTNVFIENITGVGKGTIQVGQGSAPQSTPPPINITLSNILLQNSTSAAQPSLGVLHVTNSVNANTNFIVKNVTIINATNNPIHYDGGICFQNVKSDLDRTNFTFTNAPIVSNTGTPSYRTIALRSCSFNNTGWWPKMDGNVMYTDLTNNDMGYYNITSGYDYGWATNSALLYFPDNQTSPVACIPNWTQSITDCSLGYQLTTYTDTNSCGTLDYLPTNNGTYHYCDYTNNTISRCGIIQTPGTYTLDTDLNNTLNTKDTDYDLNNVARSCIYINSSNVYLDLNNHYITDSQGTSSYDSGQSIGFEGENISIKNGRIIGYASGNGGIGSATNKASYPYIFGNNILLENITFSGLFNQIIRVCGSGICQNMSNNITMRNMLVENVTTGTFITIPIVNGQRVVENITVQDIIFRNTAFTSPGFTLQANNVIFSDVSITNSSSSSRLILLLGNGIINNFFEANITGLVSGIPAHVITGNWTISNSVFNAIVTPYVSGTNGLGVSFEQATALSTVLLLYNNSFYTNYNNFSLAVTYTPLRLTALANVDTQSSGNIGWMLLPNTINSGGSNSRAVLAYYNDTQGGYTATGTYMPEYNMYYNNQGYIAPPYPKVDTFNGVTSNFTNATLDELQNYSGLILENTVYGKIEWNGITNVTGANFDAYIKILSHRISVDSTALSSTINTSANISIYGINYVTPKIYKDNALCTDCVILSNSGGIIKFNVSGFSNYTIVSTVGDNYTQLYTFDATNVSFGLSQMGTTSDGRVVVVPGYWSSDYGSTWNSYVATSPVNLSQSGTAIYVHPDNSFWLIGASAGTAGPIYRSTDNGTTWTNVTGNLPWYRIKCNNVSVCLATTRITSVGTTDYIYRSNNSGVTWYQAANLTIPAYGVPYGLYLSDTNESLVGTYGSGVNNGGAIFYANNSMVYNITNAPSGLIQYYREIVCNANMSLCYAAADGQPQYGLYYSTNKTGWIADTRNNSFGQKYGISATPDLSTITLGPVSGDLQTSHYGSEFITASSGSYDNVTPGWPWRALAISQDGHQAYALGANTIFRSSDTFCSICSETCSPCGGGCTATNLSQMYYGVTNFDATYGNITGWDTSCITDMTDLFQYSDFNQDISGWNTSNVVRMQYVFRGSPFNQPIGSWDTSKVAKMDGMFRDTPFNQDISGWNTSSVTQMINMFNNATSYNQPMNNWDVSKVTNTANMFQGATSFNQPLNNWNTGRNTFMLLMFANTTFDQNLSSWNVVNVTNMDNMFTGGSLSIANYDALLNSWSTQSVKSNVLLGVGTTQYTAIAARNILTSTYNWTITDGGIGPVAIPPSVTNFDGTTSNFTNLTFEQLTNYSGLILENTSNGKIEWNGVTNVNGANFDAYVNIDYNLISVDSANLHSSINSPTNISIYNVNIVNPWVYKNGVYCTSGSGCNILSNNGSTIKFTAPSFSNYTLGNCSEIWVQQPPMTCTGLNNNYTIIYADTNTCGTTYTLPANNGTVITCVLISYGSGTTTGYTSGTSSYINVSTNANYTIIKIYNATGGEVASNLLTSTVSNFTNSSVGLFDALHPAEYGFDNNYSTYAQPNATGYAIIYINQTIPYMATRLSQWNLVTYSNDGPGIDVNITILDNCWLYPTLQVAVEMYNDVGIHYVYPQCYNGTSWNILTIDQNSNHSGLYENPMYWILANGTDYTNTNMTEGVFYYNATGYPQSGMPVSTATQNFTIITHFHNESYNVTFPYPNNFKLNSHTLAVPFTSNDTYYNYTVYHVQGLSNLSYNFNYTTTAKTYTFTLPDGDYYYSMTVYDKAGNSQYYDPNITIDVTPPVITYLTNTQADNSYIGFNKTNATVNISVTDTYLNTTTIWLYKSGIVVDSYSAYNQTLMNKTFTGLTNGVYKFNVTATDDANNTGIAATRTFTIIDTFQTGLYTVTYNYPNDYVSNVSANNLINFTTTDPYYAYAIYNVSGVLTNTTVQGFTPTLTEGIYNYNVRIYDLAGNSYLYPTQNITVDGTPPVINYIGATEGANSYIGFNRTNITVNIQVTDMHLNSTTNTIYLYDNASNLISQVNNTNLTTFTGLSAGVYKFNATSIDTFGNIGSATTRTVTIVPFFNTSAYTINFVHINDTITTATFNAVNFTTTDPYYNQVTYGLSQIPSGFTATETTSRQFKNYTVPSDGTYRNFLTIFDLAGNSQLYEQNITISAGIPTLAYAADTDNDNSYKNQPYIFVHILPNATNATNLTTIITLYNSTFGIVATANNTNTSNFTGLTDGVYHFNAVASNNGYNTTALTRTVTIHTSFSSGLYTVTFPTPNATLIGTLTFNATVFNTTDPYYAYAVYSIAGNTYPSGTYSDSTNTTAKFKSWTSPDSSGYFQYGVTIYDLAGNSLYYGPRMIDIDTTAPTYNYQTPFTEVNNSYVPLRPLYLNPGLAWIGQEVYVYDAHPNDAQTEFSLYNSVGTMIGDVWGSSQPQHQTVFYGYDATPTVLNLTTGTYHFSGHITDALGHITILGTRYVTVVTAFNTSAYSITSPNTNNAYIKVNNFNASFTSVDPYYNTATYTILGLTNGSYGYSVTTANKTYTFTNVPDGRYYYSVNVTDLAGNYHYYDPNITIDTTPPTINFTNNSDGSYVYQRPYLYLETNTTDTNINYTTIYVYNSTGGLVTNFTGNTSITTFTTINLTDAFYYVNATAVDLAGNNASTATYQIQLDYIKNAVQFYASEKVTDNHLYYNITFNSTGNNFQQNSPGLSKSTTVNNIPWNIYNITIIETVNGSYYTCNYYNWNATNNYVFPNCALYNSLDLINITHSYLGTAINNYNVTIVNTANSFIEIDANVSNYSIGLLKGLNYTIYFDQQSFLSKNITYAPVNSTEILNVGLNQTIITLVFKSAFSGLVLNGTNITINDTQVLGKIFGTTTGNITFNPNSGLKNFTMQASGDIIAQPVTLTFTDRQIATIDVLLYPILNISFYDERLSLLNQTFFNFTHTTEAKYTLYCYYPQNFTISGTILNTTNGPLNIPTPCIFNRIRFDLLFTNIDASTFSYYRTITFAPTTTNFAFPVYLADHTSTDTVETALKPYDIFGIYTVDQNTQIQIKEIFPSGTQLITSDYMDSEGKITATLMTAGQYIITVLADDAPIRTLGPYYADSAGTKILRLFDVTLTGPTNEQEKILAQTQILDNDSIQMHFADATATTQALTLNIFDVGCDSPLLPSRVPIMQEIYTANQLITANYQVFMTYNVPNSSRYMNHTSNKVYCTTYNRTDTSNRIQTTGVTAVYDSRKRLPAQFDSAWTLPWIMILVLATLALGANARTAAPVTLLISFLAFLLYGWQWWGTGVTGALPSVALGLTIVLAIFFNFKRVS